MRLLHVLLIPALTATIATPRAADGQTCTVQQIEERESTLPDFVVVEADETPGEALMRIFGCEQVAAPDAESAAQAAQAAAEQAQEAAQQAQAAAEQVQTVVEQTAAAGQQAQTADEQAQMAGQQAEAAGEQAQMAGQQAQTAGRQAAMVGQSVQEAGFMGIDGLWSDFLALLDRGLLPIERISVQIRSRPEGAAIFISDRFEANTTVTAWIRNSVLDTLRLEMTGYDVCGYKDGIFRPVSETGGDYAIFECTLAATKP